MPGSSIIDISLVKQLVIDAGRDELLPRFQHTAFSYKQDGSFITEADLSVQKRLQQALLDLYPNSAVLGEEMPEQQQAEIIANGKNSFWCLDPVDGTSNFASGIPFFSISLALIENGQPTVAIVYDPNRDECFSAVRGKGAFLNEKILDTSTAAHLASRIATGAPYASQRSFGSVALDWAWLAAGRGQIYLHGKQKLWDYAAGWLILKEAGGVASTLQGDTGFNAELAPRSAVAASSGDLYQQWFSWIND